MAGEPKRVFATALTLEANGASIANNAIGQADDDNVLAADHGDYPHAQFVATVSYSVAPTAGTGIDLVLRPLNISGTTDAPAPTATYRRHTVGTFWVNAATGAQTLLLDVEFV